MLDVDLSLTLNTFDLSVQFTVPSGETLVLLGESGAGKSTILRLLAGLQYPHQGHIIMNNEYYFEQRGPQQRRLYIPPQQRAIGYVFQDYVLFPHLTVFENVAFGLRTQRVSMREIKTRVSQVLAQLRLDGFERRYPAQLSGGQQQRVAIARVLVLQPRLLLLDEPLSALDVQTRREVRQELRQILAGTDITTVLVTHQYMDALFFGQHILVLERGRVVQQGDQRQLCEAPRSPYVAELVGLNFFRGKMLHYETATTCLVRLFESEYDIVATLKESEQDDTRTIPTGTEVSVVVDPRSVTLAPLSYEGSARNILRGRVIHIIPLPGSRYRNGEEDRVRVTLALSRKYALTAEITTASARRLELSEGQLIYATFKAVEAYVYQ